MQLECPKLERALKSLGFGVSLFLLAGVLTAPKAAALLDRFDWIELGWVVYNGALAILFLVRSTPTRVSMDPLHWFVALATSFSGLFFRRGAERASAVQHAFADGLMSTGLALGLLAAISLGRSYAILPALRGVQTGWAYRVIRHPMYLSSIVIRLGYLAIHPSGYNLAVFGAMVCLYVPRVRFEEEIMRNDERYREYLSQVRWRLVPGVY